MLERDRLVVSDAEGARIRIVGTTRWSDFDLFGVVGRAKAMRAGSYFMDLMQATQGGRPFDVEAMRAEALACRAWLEAELKRPRDGWDRTVVVTHFAPSVKSADPRYGARSGTASFCNADDDLLPFADVWLHGHLHCVHDYAVARAGGPTRVVCNSRGHEWRGEAEAHRPGSSSRCERRRDAARTLETRAAVQPALDPAHRPGVLACRDLGGRLGLDRRDGVEAERRSHVGRIVVQAPRRSTRGRQVAAGTGDQVHRFLRGDSSRSQYRRCARKKHPAIEGQSGRNWHCVRNAS